MIARSLKIIVSGLFVALALAACGKTDRPLTTAERVAKIAGNNQAEPAASPPRKSVDYLATMKKLDDRATAPTATPIAPASTENKAVEATQVASGQK